MDLLIEKSEVVDMLQEMGCILQEESHLSDQLNGQASEDRYCTVLCAQRKKYVNVQTCTVHSLCFRNQKRDLQERSERFTNKARGLDAEILEVKQHLAEARARNMAGKGSKEDVYILVSLYKIQFVICCLSLPTAEALIHAPSSKSKQNQGEPK